MNQADHCSYKLNIWDVGGQKTIRSYWKNYFEKTDALIWVVDATDRLRVDDCRVELRGLLLEEVRCLASNRWQAIVENLTNTSETGWGKPISIFEQDRCGWMHD